MKNILEVIVSIVIVASIVAGVCGVTFKETAVNVTNKVEKGYEDFKR